MNTITEFFLEARAELKKIVWPTRKDTIRYTIAVIAFSIAVAVVLGVADLGLLKGIEAFVHK